MINEKDYWNARYSQGGNSGYGSYDEQLDKKLAWILPLDFDSICEVGCGDFNFGKNILRMHPAKYLGLDISEYIVNKNKEDYPLFNFEVFNYHNAEPADLVLCVDVLFHIIEDKDVDRMLSELDRVWTKYLVITAYERDEKFENHVRIRKFDPSRFGTPIVREVVEEDGTLYFYIFKK